MSNVLYRRRCVIGGARAAVAASTLPASSAVPADLRGDDGDRIPEHAALWSRLPLPFTPAQAWHRLSPATQSEIGAAVINMALAEYVHGDVMAEADQFLDDGLRSIPPTSRSTCSTRSRPASGPFPPTCTGRRATTRPGLSPEGSHDDLASLVDGTAATVNQAGLFEPMSALKHKLINDLTNRISGSPHEPSGARTMSHAIIPNFSVSLVPINNDGDRVPFHVDPILAAIEAHEEAYAVFQAAAQPTATIDVPRAIDRQVAKTARRSCGHGKSRGDAAKLDHERCACGRS
ncbi:hypothetical protein [Methylobacterium sp. WL9]|uniref:hypothetical protein n=1 Tax=Methylobacterium sp. WL9 TaxID=2603898 RepID=UPI0011CC5654|nr:hypothetical protein [Methylobacterium sp. WL9]TXN23194.1 hypothetical protein FV217_07765 [Methylobacterium sp. WL9]